ncbi:MAG: hypothetical protein AAF721_15870 [Myxococcota bacterium]
MYATRVRYTVNDSYVEQNKANIRKVMDEVRAKSEGGVQYNAFVEADGKTFVHIVVVRDEALKSVVPSTDAFKAFQAALKPNLEVPPANESWSLVGATYDL